MWLKLWNLSWKQNFVMILTWYWQWWFWQFVFLRFLTECYFCVGYFGVILGCFTISEQVLHVFLSRIIYFCASFVNFALRGLFSLFLIPAITIGAWGDVTIVIITMTVVMTFLRLAHIFRVEVCFQCLGNVSVDCTTPTDCDSSVCDVVNLSFDVKLCQPILVILVFVEWWFAYSLAARPSYRLYCVNVVVHPLSCNCQSNYRQSLATFGCPPVLN